MGKTELSNANAEISVKILYYKIWVMKKDQGPHIPKWSKHLKKAPFL